jgi:hypothetical protein
MKTVLGITKDDVKEVLEDGETREITDEDVQEVATLMRVALKNLKGLDLWKVWKMVLEEAALLVLEKE